ncbi:MAG: AMP-dependent synthetase/ligase [Acidimicrobiales bacterium]
MTDAVAALNAEARAVDAEFAAALEGATIPGQFLDASVGLDDAVMFRWLDGEDWKEMTHGEFRDAVSRVATGLAGKGVGSGDRVLLMMRNRVEFHVADLAALFVGATPVSVYNSSSVEQVTYLANDAAVKLAIVGDAGFAQIVGDARAGVPTLTGVGVVDADGATADFTYADLLANEPADLPALAAELSPSDLATLIYTSGTTGPSKGVMLDHTNVLWAAECLRRAIDWESYVGKKAISYLPMAHIAERVTGHYMALLFGTEITCCPDPTLLATYTTHVRPNILFGVPRVWEKVYNGVNAVLAADAEKSKAVGEALEAAGPIREKMTFGTATDEEIETYNFLDAVAFSTIRELVGLDQVELAITGAAPIPAEVLSWFRTIGVPLSEIYGLSETTGPLSWAPYRVKPGSVGPGAPGIEVALGDDGEVLCRGGNVFRGYLNQPDKTEEVLDADGWFHTGDIGEFDDEGYLKIVDRKKELIITAGGKNLSPANLEAALKMIPLVGQACAIGDNKPFVSALVTLDPDMAPQWAAANGIEFTTLEALALEDAVIAAVDEGLAAAMADFNNAERVKKVRILGEEWLPDTDVLTPTSKLKRRGIHSRYEEEIEHLYS